MESTLKPWAAVGGALAGAVAASACCVVPLFLLWLGISGAWIVPLAPWLYGPHYTTWMALKT